MSNRLGKEKSPYLLQHRDNPVDWYPWGEEAFERARREEKLIFLSIGYSTCYWCHVMEKDSFQTEEVAALLNRNFVSIKVDREERPDVDRMYMDAVIAICGHGGWPMSVFLTPDLKPVFGGTFFYRAQFLQLLERIAEIWKNSPADLLENGEKLYRLLGERDAFPRVTLDAGIFARAYREMKQSYDLRFGGFGRAPKFPPSIRLMLLNRLSKRLNDPEPLHIARSTLEAMARGGIYDQLGGGFHRYSTDEQWFIPHFEKMLYDNALLALNYLEGYKVTGEKLFANVAEETLNYVLREMTSPEGGFYSAQDAGEVGREGEFYVWRWSEFESLLTADELTLIKHAYGVTPRGNFEDGTNILRLQQTIPWDEKSRGALATVREKLFRARLGRSQPHVDDKILTGWNGLMISALVHGHEVLGAEVYRTAAQSAAHFVRTKLLREGKLLRRYRDGEASLHGTLDDYAFFIAALLDLYSVDFDLTWVRLARFLQEQLDVHFSDLEGGGYFFTASDEPHLLVRRKDFADDALPSGNAVAALNLLRLYHYTTERRYLERADAIFTAMSGLITQYPSACASALIALDFREGPVRELVIVGPKDSGTAASLRAQLAHEFHPYLIVAWSDGTHRDDADTPPLLHGRDQLNGQTTFYVCENNSCKLPVTDPQEAWALLTETPF